MTEPKEATDPAAAPANITFTLNEVESRRVRDFLAQHRHRDVRLGAIGGHITYSFTPTSLGLASGLRCAVCGGESDVTDFDDW